MRTRLTDIATPDLFSAAGTQAPPREERKGTPSEIGPTGLSSPPRHVLPKDLPGALARLDDVEIGALLAAMTNEAKRRRQLLPPKTTKSAEAHQGRSAKPVRPRPGQACATNDAPSLTLGKANAVRAAFAAGVKPSTIARQFGISQSAVREVLPAEATRRKS